MAGNASDNPTIRQTRASGAPPPAEIAEHFPQLQIVGLLGQGGMGAVYEARQKRLDRPVALKVLLPDADREASFAERFEREARSLARLQHPNIVTVHDSGQSGDLYYFIMEYVDGSNLRQVMNAGAVHPSKALAIIGQVCDALAYAHKEGIVHRDIKPENILIDKNGRVKIADFGIAKLVSRGSTDYSLTAPQQIMGTMHYMAPEQIESTAEVDHRADLYSLGVVLYELLTGELPIGRFPLPSQRAPVDGSLDEIVLHALEKEPARRYQRADDVKTDIEAVALRQSPGPAPKAAVVAGSVASAYYPVVPVKSAATAYLLWCLCFVGVTGIHRFYAGRWITGIIWILTGGIFMIGQFIDLILIPGMIRVANLEAALLASGTSASQSPGSNSHTMG